MIRQAYTIMSTPFTLAQIEKAVFKGGRIEYMTGSGALFTAHPLWMVHEGYCVDAEGLQKESAYASELEDKEPTHYYIEHHNSDFDRVVNTWLLNGNAESYAPSPAKGWPLLQAANVDQYITTILGSYLGDLITTRL